MNASKSKIFINNFLEGKEKEIFGDILVNIIEELKIKGSVDMMQAELASLYYIKALRAIKLDIPEDKSAENLDRMLRMHLKDLKATRLSKEEKKTSIQVSAAEFLSNIIKPYDKTEEDIEIQEDNRKRK